MSSSEPGSSKEPDRQDYLLSQDYEMTPSEPLGPMEDIFDFASKDTLQVLSKNEAPSADELRKYCPETDGIISKIHLSCPTLRK